MSTIRHYIPNSQLSFDYKQFDATVLLDLPNSVLFADTNDFGILDTAGLFVRIQPYHFVAVTIDSILAIDWDKPRRYESYSPFKNVEFKPNVFDSNYSSAKLDRDSYRRKFGWLP